jgi:hypothetical protein
MASGWEERKSLGMCCRVIYQSNILIKAMFSRHSNMDKCKYGTVLFRVPINEEAGRGETKHSETKSNATKQKRIAKKRNGTKQKENKRNTEKHN